MVWPRLPAHCFAPHMSQPRWMRCPDACSARVLPPPHAPRPPLQRAYAHATAPPLLTCMPPRAPTPPPPYALPCCSAGTSKRRDGKKPIPMKVCHCVFVRVRVCACARAGGGGSGMQHAQAGKVCVCVRKGGGAPGQLWPAITARHCVVLSCSSCCCQGLFPPIPVCFFGGGAGVTVPGDSSAWPLLNPAFPPCPALAPHTSCCGPCWGSAVGEPTHARTDERTCWVQVCRCACPT